MAKYAFRDEKRENLVYATDATDKDATYYCPNKNCNAHLQLCSVGGEKTRYFSARKAGYKHDANCMYYNSQINFNRSMYDEEKFKFTDAINRILGLDIAQSSKSKNKSSSVNESKDKTKKKAISTILQIYSMCKELKYTDVYAGTPISGMLLDDRTFCSYKDIQEGTFLVEARINDYCYDPELKEIFLKAPINNEKYSIKLSFEDEELYKKLRNEIYDNRHKIAIVAGIWKKTSDNKAFRTVVRTMKQVRILNKNK